MKKEILLIGLLLFCFVGAAQASVLDDIWNLLFPVSNNNIAPAMQSQTETVLLLSGDDNNGMGVIPTNPSFGIPIPETKKDAYVYGFTSFPKENELLEKRTRSSKTFNNKDGTQTTIIFSGLMHYFDGNKLEDMNGWIDHLPDKKNIVLAVKPITSVGAKTSFPAYSFKVKTGIIVELQGENLVFKDSNNWVIAIMGQPVAMDDANHVLKISFGLASVSATKNVTLEVDSDWLKNAVYPVVLDPDTNYVSMKGDGQIKRNASSTACSTLDGLTASLVANDTNTTMKVGGCQSSACPS